MSTTPLDPAQEAALAALVASGRLQSVPPDPARASRFMAQAADKLTQLPLLTSEPVRYTVAYDAAHDVGEALLAAFGYRTANGQGQHAALGLFLEAVIDAPPEAAAVAVQFDQHRRARNQHNYQAIPVGAAQAQAAEHVARTLHRAATTRGVG